MGESQALRLVWRVNSARTWKGMRSVLVCVIHQNRNRLRWTRLSERQPRLTVLTIDGIGAYDHAFRTAMLSKLLEVPSLRNLLPFARVACAQPSLYVWEDADDVRHNIEQHEDGEQGDPLMPILFSLGLHNALEEVQQILDPREFLSVYLGDVFILSSPRRTRVIFNLLENTLLKRAGIHLHIGKTRVWNVCGKQVPDIDDHGDDVWSTSGVMILGTSLGRGKFLSRIEDERLLEVHRLWDSISWSGDLHCAWQVLIQCAGPHCHHLLRTLSPSLTRHRYLADFGGIVGQNPRRPLIATLPMWGVLAWGHRRGWPRNRVGLRGLTRCRCWNNDSSDHVRYHVFKLHSPLPRGVWASAARLDREGSVGGPSWSDLRCPTSPDQQPAEPGEWQHGWQYHASSSSEHHVWKTVVHAQSSAADQAHLRWYSGPCASQVLIGCPKSPEFEVKPHLFRTLVFERMRLPLIKEARCECGRITRLQREAQKSVPQVRENSFKSSVGREVSSAYVPRSRSDSEVQRKVER